MNVGRNNLLRILTRSKQTKTNVDLKDVEHLSKFASEWWDPAGPMKGLHALNTIRVPFIREGLASVGYTKNVNKLSVLEGINCLEVGCGAGILTEALARLKANVVGLDASEELISIAEAHKKQNLNIDYVCSTIEDHSENRENFYDTVVISEVLEHIVDKESFLQASIKALKPGGSIFVTTFDKTVPSFLGAVVAAEYILKIVPQGTHDWEQFISLASLKKILHNLNCQTLVVHGFRYEFWNNTVKWQTNTDIHYALHAIKH